MVGRIALNAPPAHESGGLGAIRPAILAGTEPGPPEMRLLRYVCAVTGGPTSVSARFCNYLYLYL